MHSSVKHFSYDTSCTSLIDGAMICPQATSRTSDFKCKGHCLALKANVFAFNRSL